MNKNTLIRNILYILGAVLFLAIIACSIYHTKTMWETEFKSHSFSSFTEYYFSRAKGELLIAVIAGIIPISIGAFINAKHKFKKE